jgi:type II secretory pathway component HofQ
MDRTMMIVVGVAVVVLALVAIWLMQQRRRAHLRQRFGPEYERSLQQHGSATVAERELDARERRVAKLDIRALSREETARFSQAWLLTQQRFVDSPGDAVAEADRLVGEVMRTRGYPMAEFEQRAADISVDHPQVVANYRAARAIVDRNRRGEASTEDLRQALVHYRELFADLLNLQREPLRRAAGGR